MNAKIRMLALLAFSLIGCAATLPVVPKTAPNPNPELASDLFFQNAKIKHDIYQVDGWDGDVSAIASQVAKGWHDRGVSTDFQQESRNGTRVSFSAHKKGSPNSYRVIVQELSRDPGIVLVLYATWPEDLDAAFSKQLEIEVDEIIRRMVIKPVRTVPGAATI